MNPRFEIFNKVINKNSPTLIIAEIGINHMGSEELCKKMIISALKNGADCVKLQSGFVEECFDENSKSYNTFKDTQFSKETLIRLNRVAEDLNGFLFSSPGDFSSISLLEEVGFKAYKVSSGQFTNLPLIRELIKIKKPIILSTGMSTVTEISRIYEELTKNNFTNFALLHTIALYPSVPKQLNLGFIKKINEKFNVISGYSDHTIGELACLTAVASGAKIIEKHFTIDTKLPGGDNKLSILPKGFKKMCDQIRDIEKMFFSSSQKPHPDELGIKPKRIRKIVAKVDLQEGEKINISNVKFIRVENNEDYFSAFDWDKVINKKIKFKIKKNQLINKRNIF